MTSLTIDLPDEQRAALAAKARLQGLSAEQYARQILEQDLAPEWLKSSWMTAKSTGRDSLSPEDIDAEQRRDLHRVVGRATPSETRTGRNRGDWRTELHSQESLLGASC